ncbi:hypothetical protein [Streptomyces sp. CdTB01]|uniref:hypothetical protein n=1 Tax=Streptomyces sp. CdTB01 TaxID=1725411 RepID=UPI00073A994B|nr:hypothetical protein [Streptomyces sp. CdTB01]ALV33202.1 hypothetical protein AS200_15050 [Streptomyces sp. CdTB01]
MTRNQRKRTILAAAVLAPALALTGGLAYAANNGDGDTAPAHPTGTSATPTARPDRTTTPTHRDDCRHGYRTPGTGSGYDHRQTAPSTGGGNRSGWGPGDCGDHPWGYTQGNGYSSSHGYDDCH